MVGFSGNSSYDTLLSKFGVEKRIIKHNIKNNLKEVTYEERFVCKNY